MTITAGLAAELQLLTEAVDLPAPDIADTLTRLVADARTAVDSYLGLSIAITATDRPSISPSSARELGPMTSERPC